MKQVKLFTTICIAASIILLSSCNSGDDKKTDENKTDSTIKTEMTVAPSGPTLIGLIRHKVADYDKWKPGYDAGDSLRLASGVHNYVIARGVDDPNTILVATQIDDVDKAKAFAAMPELKDGMKKAGVVGPPLFDYLESVMNDTTAIQETVRVMIRIKIKDWDAWKKSFDDHKQARMDAGLTDRVISYTVGDNHHVSLVFAVADLDKAKAFMKSDDLKNKMKESGVEGAPDIFYYRIVQKY